MDSSILCFDFGWLGVYETFAFKTLNVFLHCVDAHACCFANSTVARMALECFSILTVHKKSIDGYFSGGQVKAKDRLRKRKEISGIVTLFGIIIAIIHLIQITLSSPMKYVVRFRSNLMQGLLPDH